MRVAKLFNDYCTIKLGPFSPPQFWTVREQFETVERPDRKI